MSIQEDALKTTNTIRSWIFKILIVFAIINFISGIDLGNISALIFVLFLLMALGNDKAGNDYFEFNWRTVTGILLLIAGFTTYVAGLREYAFLAIFTGIILIFQSRQESKQKK